MAATLPQGQLGGPGAVPTVTVLTPAAAFLFLRRVLAQFLRPIRRWVWGRALPGSQEFTG